MGIACTLIVVAALSNPLHLFQNEINDGTQLALQRLTRLTEVVELNEPGYEQVVQSLYQLLYNSRA